MMLRKTNFGRRCRLSNFYIQAAGGISEVRNYEGKNMRQAADLMRQLDNAQIWMEPKKKEHNL